MDPSRKRTIRFVVLLSLACVLSAGLVYTSFSASSEAKTPRQLLSSAQPGESYELTGRVAKGSIERSGTSWDFRVEERTGGPSVPIHYEGSMPDPFREGREVIVDVRKQGAGFVASKVTTKCPSKFTAEKS